MVVAAVDVAELPWPCMSFTRCKSVRSFAAFDWAYIDGPNLVLRGDFIRTDTDMVKIENV